MGFGYNSGLEKFGERIDMLGFFAWMKRLQAAGVEQWVIWDAAPYATVNLLPTSLERRLGKDPSARDILDSFLEVQSSKAMPFYEWVRQNTLNRNCTLRSEYLKRLVDFSGVSARYINCNSVFEQDSQFETALEEALEYVQWLGKNNPCLVTAINGTNPRQASQLYLPLEIAEALYLQESLGVGGKFGPRTEEYFDKTIIGLQQSEGRGYVTLRCPLAPGRTRPAYLRTCQSFELTTSVKKSKTIRRVLRNDPEYRSFVEQYLEPFRDDDESIVQSIKRLQGALNEGTLQ